MSPSPAATCKDYVRRSVENTLSGENIADPDRTSTMTAVKPVVVTDQNATSTDCQGKSWVVQADEWLQKDVQGCWCIRAYQRGTWLLQLLVLAQFSFVGGVDVYTVLWARTGFAYRAAWASLGVSILASGINMLGSVLHRKDYELAIVLYLFVGVVWAPIEISLRALSLRVLNAADGSDGATRTILVLFALDLTAFAVLALCAISFIGLIIYLVVFDEGQEKEGSKELNKNQTPDQEKQGGSQASRRDLSD